MVYNYLFNISPADMLRSDFALNAGRSARTYAACSHRQTGTRGFKSTTFPNGERMSHIAVVFPGQGSQEAGMGRQLAESSSEAMDFWKKAERISGLPLRAIYWEGDEVAMADTRSLQPALTVVNLNLWRLLAPRARPMAAAGHSLGEYAALTAAGVLDAQETLELVSLRGRLMAEADPEGKGAMAAVLKLDEESLAEVVRQSREAAGETLLIANFNTPGQMVISGGRGAVEHALGAVKERKGRALPLKVSGAFHSPLMEEASRELRGPLLKARWQKPRFPVYCNVHGRAVNDADAARQCALDQMTSSVRWADAMRNQWLDGARVWVEAGPKAVLSKMVAPCLEGLVPQGRPVRAETVTTAEAVASFQPFTQQ